MMKSKHVMLDLETLSPKSNAAIVSIGAVEFDPVDFKLGMEFYAVVDVDTHISLGGHVSGSTIAWWMKQSEEAREVFRKPDAVNLHYALDRFSIWMCELRGINIPELGLTTGAPVNVWGNGAAFDNVVLSNAYDAAGMIRPWSYREDRCFRTLRAQYPDVPPVDLGVAHNALDDARAQALHLFEMLKQGPRIG